MSEWKEFKISDVGNVITGKTPSRDNAEDFGEVMPFVTPSDYKNFTKYIYQADRSLSAIGIRRLQNKVLPEKSIMVTCIGSDMGKVALNKEPVITNQQINSIIPNPKAANSDYLFYSLTDMYETLRTHGLDGTAVPILNKSTFENLPIAIPPLPEQRAIAGVLSSLDDKIELLHRQNKTLEAMAEALYRHFFIEGRNSDWKECTVSELAVHEKQSIHPKRIPETTFYHYSIAAFDESHMPVPESGASIQSNKYKVTGNSILFCKLNPDKDKRIWLIPDGINVNSVCSTEFQIMSPKADKYLFFLYGFISSPVNYDEIAAGVGGTSGSHQRIDPDVIFKFPCFNPDDTTLTDYNDMVSPLFIKMHHNLESVQTLSHLRDTLIPKLMSGEVRVKYN